MYAFKKILIFLVIGLFLVGGVIAVSSSSSLNYLTKSLADRIYCKIGDCGYGDSGVFTLYIESSKYPVVFFNISKVEHKNYNFSVRTGEVFIFGEEQ